MTRDYRKCASAPIATNKIRQVFQHTNFLINHGTTIYFETFREWFICLPLPPVDIFVASTFLQRVSMNWLLQERANLRLHEKVSQ